MMNDVLDFPDIILLSNFELSIMSIESTTKHILLFLQFTHIYIYFYLYFKNIYKYLYL